MEETTPMPAATETAQAAPHASHTEAKGIWSWMTTVDHKRIGVMYFLTSFFFFFVGGLEALLIRIQLMKPENAFISAETYSQMFTMHGTTMVFLVAMPMAVAFFNYIVPLQIGARDVAFPRLNALSFWIFLFGGLFINDSVAPALLGALLHQNALLTLGATFEVPQILHFLDRAAIGLNECLHIRQPEPQPFVRLPIALEPFEQVLAKLRIL